jgi:hypothetical protein
VMLENFGRVGRDLVAFDTSVLIVIELIQECFIGRGEDGAPVVGPWCPEGRFEPGFGHQPRKDRESGGEGGSVYGISKQPIYDMHEPIGCICVCIRYNRSIYLKGISPFTVFVDDLKRKVFPFLGTQCVIVVRKGSELIFITSPIYDMMLDDFFDDLLVERRINGRREGIIGGRKNGERTSTVQSADEASLRHSSLKRAQGRDLLDIACDRRRLRGGVIQILVDEGIASGYNEGKSKKANAEAAPSANGCSGIDHCRNEILNSKSGGEWLSKTATRQGNAPRLRRRG